MYVGKHHVATVAMLVVAIIELQFPQSVDKGARVLLLQLVAAPKK
jgi:hypothetical protein